MRVARAEWTKLRTVPSNGWLIAGTVVLTIVLGALVVAAAGVSQCPAPDCQEDTARLSLSGVWLGQVTVVVLAVLAFTTEHATRMIHTTVAAVPRRALVFLGKAGVVSAVTLAAGALGVGGSFVAARAILPRNGFTVANGYPPLTLADEPTARAVIGTVGYLGLIALLAYGLAMILRDTAGAITATMLLLYATPVAAMVITNPVWQQRLQRFSPMTAGLAVQITKGTAPIGPWQGLGVLAAYAGAALLAGAVLFERRNA